MWDKPTWKQLFLRIPKKQERHYDFQLLSSHASNMALENNYKTNRLCYILTKPKELPPKHAKGQEISGC